MGDHSSKVNSSGVGRSSLMRLLIALAANYLISRKDLKDEKKRCIICKKESEFVEFSDFGKAGRAKDNNRSLRL